MARIGVFGGSFNPVHRGHLFVAMLAAEAAELERVLFVPAADPPHKEGMELAPAPHRVAMLGAALASEPGTGISDVELRPAGPRFTVDTLQVLAAERPGDELVFILGMDSLLELPGWRSPERILERHRIVAVNRPGLDAGAVPPPLASRCLLVEGNPFAISATGVRRRVAAGLPLRHLVPRAVEDYIREHGLYTAGGSGI